MSTKIGFQFNENTPEREIVVPEIPEEETAPRKCLAEIRFPNVYRPYTYYNDTFDLKIGDKVFVSGKLDGVMGTVEGLSYNFKIDLSKYERVIRKVESHIKGEFNLVGRHMLTFDQNALPFEKVITWFDLPSNLDTKYVVSSDGSTFDLNDAPVCWSCGEHGDYLHTRGRIQYISINGNRGRAIVKDDNNIHKIEFDFKDFKISNFFCDCYDMYICGHQYAVILQLREILKLIEENYAEQYANSNCFALVKRETLEAFATDSKVSGKVVLE